MDDFSEFSMLFCSKKKKKDCLYGRLKRLSDWTKVHLYPLLVEEKNFTAIWEWNLPSQLYDKQLEKLKWKSRIKLNHNIFKVITELLKSGPSVKKKSKTKQIIK